jgi:multidrug efflux pump subunit AcrB
VGPKLVQKLRTVPGLADVTSDQQDHGLEASLVIDRDTASRLGVSPALIDDTLYDAFGQRQVAITYTPLNQYHVVLEVAACSSGSTPTSAGRLRARGVRDAGAARGGDEVRDGRDDARCEPPGQFPA